MSNKIKLTVEQSKIVEDNLKLVHFIVHKYTKTECNSNPNDLNTSYEDLFQTGSLALCKAAYHFNPDFNVKFGTYASTAITNAIIQVLKKSSATTGKSDPILNENEDVSARAKELVDQDVNIENQIEMLPSGEIYKAILSIKESYKGVSKKGMECLLLQLNGMSIRKIAEIFGENTQTIGAWMSRAKGKLKTDKVFKTYAELVG